MEGHLVQGISLPHDSTACVSDGHGTTVVGATSLDAAAPLMVETAAVIGGGSALGVSGRPGSRWLTAVRVAEAARDPFSALPGGWL